MSSVPNSLMTTRPQGPPKNAQFKSPSNIDIIKAIEIMSLSQSSQFGKLHNCIISLTAQVFYLKIKYTALHNEIVVGLRKRVVLLET